jgi:hypothetical protein
LSIYHFDIESKYYNGKRLSVNWHETLAVGQLAGAAVKGIGLGAELVEKEFDPCGVDRRFCWRIPVRGFDTSTDGLIPLFPGGELWPSKAGWNWLIGL